MDISVGVPGNKKCFLTGEVSRHHDKVICVTGGGVLAAAAPSGRVLEEKTSGLLGGRGQSFGTQMLNLGERLLQETRRRKVADKQRKEAQKVSWTAHESTASLLRYTERQTKRSSEIKQNTNRW